MPTQQSVAPISVQDTQWSMKSAQPHAHPLIIIMIANKMSAFYVLTYLKIDAHCAQAFFPITTHIVHVLAAPTNMGISALNVRKNTA